MLDNISLTQQTLSPLNIGDDGAKAIAGDLGPKTSIEEHPLLTMLFSTVQQLIKDYLHGSADISQLIRFSNAIESIALENKSMSPLEIQIFHAYVSGDISQQFAYKYEEPTLKHINNIAPFITQYLGSKALANLAIATCLSSLKDGEPKEIAQER
ncbi:MAG: hypothetical protein ACK5WS_00075 [Alphaproteobacteria bacterium]|jgi:hypothetical protein|nr:hypothetical protein [Candidatus Jidaibacter sp.]